MTHEWKVGDRFEFYAPNAKKNIGVHGTRGTIVSLTAQEEGKITVESDVKPYPNNDKWGGWAIHPRYLRPIPDEEFERLVNEAEDEH